MKGSPPFKTGDKVRLKTGTSPIQVMEVDYFHCANAHTCPPSYKKARYGKTPMKGWYIRFQYFSSLAYDEPRSWREANDFVYYDEQPKEQPEEATRMTDLYQTKKEPVRYGTYLITNSLKQIVLEMKGEQGVVEAFNPDDIELVLPYSVSLQRQRIEGGQEALIHVVTEKGTVEVDDFLLELSTGYFWRVVKVDAKVKSPKENKSKWMKFKGEPVTFGE